MPAPCDQDDVLDLAPAPAASATVIPDASTAAPPRRAGLQALIPTLGASTAALAACGGGGTADPAVAVAAAVSTATVTALSATRSSTTGVVVVAPTEAEASRFLAQASMGASRAQIARVVALGYSGWLDEQFAAPATQSRWDYLVAGGFNAATYVNSESGFDSAAWAKMLGAADTLRQRITLALSEIFVVAIDGLIGGGWRSFSAAAYLDLLEANAFGNHRSLLQAISLSAPMGQYLTYRGSAKANPVSGALPDENYSRELMQLFTLGLVRLGPDGVPTIKKGGSTVYTYDQTDVTGLARVFTGWDFDLGGQPYATATATPDFIRKPMVQVAGRFETGTKTFLGTTIPAGLDATTTLTRALDWIFAHLNTAPFFARQLIQRLVTSNPSPAYVLAVATAFSDNGSGVRGDLKAVIRAVLLHDEARTATAAAVPGYGKLREPMLRLSGWARAYSAASATNAWAIGNTSDPGSRLAQSPLRSPSVFNFFRPGYVPPNSGFSTQALAAPEFQITNESSVVAYLNYLQRVVAGSGVGDVLANYSSLTTLADDATPLFAEINLVLAAGRLSAATLAPLVTAVQTMPKGTAATRNNRVYAALVLVLAASEYLIQK